MNNNGLYKQTKMLHIKSSGQHNKDHIQRNFEQFVADCLLDQNALANYLPVLDAELIISLIDNFVAYAADRSKWLDLDQSQRHALFDLLLNLLQLYIEPNILLLTQVDSAISSQGFLKFLQLVDYIDEQRPSPGESQQDFMQQIAALIKLQEVISKIVLTWIGLIDVHAVNQNGNTALHMVATGVCCRSEEEIAAALLLRGATTDSLNHELKSPVDLALERSKEQVLKAMVEQKSLRSEQLLNLITACKNGNFKLCELIPLLVAELQSSDLNIESLVNLLDVLFNEVDRQANESGNRSISISLATPIASIIECILNRPNISGQNAQDIFAKMQSLLNTNHKMYLFGKALRILAINVFASDTTLVVQQNLLHYLAYDRVNSELTHEQLLAHQFDALPELAANMVKAAKSKEGHELSMQESYALHGNFPFILLVFRARHAAKIIIDDSCLTMAMKTAMQKSALYTNEQRDDLKHLLKYLGNYIWPKYERRLFAELVDALDRKANPQLATQLGLSEFNTWSCKKPFMNFLSRHSVPTTATDENSVPSVNLNTEIKPLSFRPKRGLSVK